MSHEQGFSLLELLAVVALIGIVSAITIPITDGSLKAHRLQSDAQGVKNLVGLAKMRASSQFTRARVRVDAGSNAYSLEVWDKTAAAWVVEGGQNQTSTGVSFGFGALGTPPPDTQVNIEMSPECTDGVDNTANLIANTHCVVFNSRGLPVDRDGVLYPRHALYLIGEAGVYATTITATPLVRSWRSPSNNASWTEH